jgi:hypothetical protein
MTICGGQRDAPRQILPKTGEDRGRESIWAAAARPRSGRSHPADRRPRADAVRRRWRRRADGQTGGGGQVRSVGGGVAEQTDRRPAGPEGCMGGRWDPCGEELATRSASAEILQLEKHS